MALKHKSISRLLGKADPTILEIGCNDGTDTLRFLDNFPDASVYCFEPDPRAAERWRSQVKSPRATLFEIAIGAQDGVVEFHQSDSYSRGGEDVPWDYSGSIHKPKAVCDAHPSLKFKGTVTVPLRSLDNWAAEHGIADVDFIWADVQGAEGDLVEGGPSTLAHTRYFYTEYDDGEFYETQWSLDRIAAALPNHHLMRKWAADALFVNETEPYRWLKQRLAFL